MTTESPSAPDRSPRQRSAAPTAGPHPEVEWAAGPGGLRGALLVAGSACLVALIALFDFGTGPHLSCSIFYLLPVVACAWWGGFPHGILLALGASVAWHAVDLIENPAIPAAAGVWNGVVRFGTLTLTASLVARLHAGIRREARLARTDPLTGAANARTFYEAAVADAERARRAGEPLTLAYFDVDNFKQLNDRMGHAAGDEALRNVVETLHVHLGDAGLLARLGGDEFALLLPRHGPGEALTLLEHLQGLLGQEMARRGWPVTLSVGAVTFLRPTWEVDQMIQQVDALMYGAKRKGKGRVEHAVVPVGPAPADTPSGAERRATARVLGHRTARVRGEGEAAAREEFATVCDVSEERIALSLERAFPPDTMLLVEPLSPDARTLLARVAHVTAEGGRWFHRCSLATRLAAEDLDAWLGSGREPTTPTAAPTPRRPAHRQAAS